MVHLSNGTKIGLIVMLSASAFCVWSLAWMGAATFHIVRDALK